MAKKRKTINKKTLANNEKKVAEVFSWPSFVKKALFFVCLLGILAVPAVAFMKKHDVEHDLSVVGNGTPTVVQIHDPNCPSCKRLKRNLNSVKAAYLDDIQFKTADIKTAAGSQFARKHGVPHITLLFFDAKGTHKNTLQGISSPDRIQAELEKLKR